MFSLIFVLSWCFFVPNIYVKIYRVLLTESNIVFVKRAKYFDFFISNKMHRTIRKNMWWIFTKFSRTARAKTLILSQKLSCTLCVDKGVYFFSLRPRHRHINFYFSHISCIS